MHRCQTANHAELILPQLDTVTYLLMPHAARRAALKDWSLGGKPHLFGAATACMGCGPNGQSCKTMILSRRDCAYRLANTNVSTLQPLPASAIGMPAAAARLALVVSKGWSSQAPPDLLQG